MADQVFSIQVCGSRDRACGGSNWDWTAVSNDHERVRLKTIDLRAILPAPEPTTSANFPRNKIDVVIVQQRPEAGLRIARPLLPQVYQGLMLVLQLLYNHNELLKSENAM